MLRAAIRQTTRSFNGVPLLPTSAASNQQLEVGFALLDEGRHALFLLFTGKA